MISFSQIAATFKSLTIPNYLMIVILTLMGYYLLNILKRYLTNQKHTYVLCCVFSVLVTLVIFIYTIYSICKCNVFNILIVFLFLLIIIFIFVSIIEFRELFFVYFDKKARFEKSISRYLDKNNMLNLVDDVGTSTPYKFIGTIILEEKIYAIVLEQNQIEKRDVFVTVFEVLTGNGDSREFCYDKITDEDLASTIIKKFKETNSTGYTFMQ